MSNTYGMAVPGSHAGAAHRKPARFLVVIEGPEGTKIARLFSEQREPAGEFDAGTDDVVRLTRGLTPVHGATGREWDAALAGHSEAERLGAAVFTLTL